jgi:hypothetical protein
MLLIYAIYEILLLDRTLCIIRCAVYIIFRFQQDIDSLVEILAEGNCNDEKCFMEQCEPATNHPYCHASHIYELNECFFVLLPPPTPPSKTV